MNYYYSPHTGEHIATDAPADWMGSTSIAPPGHDTQTQGLFFIDGGWKVINPALPPAPPTEAEQLAQVTAEVLAEVRALRTQFFSSIAGIQSEATARGNHADALAIALVQEGARNITETDLTGCTTKAQIEKRFLDAWLALVSSAPGAVVHALRKLKS